VQKLALRLGESKGVSASARTDRTIVDPVQKPVTKMADLSGMRSACWPRQFQLELTARMRLADRHDARRRAAGSARQIDGTRRR